ncbi:BspA family leucine-rich repeat surface protein [Flammeovirga aprica]|uniref:DUF285 domain-containing protein n=1 Tax=Flammeovirga aprica JL-4 TaxID=694437 RepID=A0A7X9XB47_9BACT|nr:BspA family leucine-rich repeat surface protein [Flammeovirga aprica]NME70345.1 DUF285 domain-containing protein [Flammeovirga aprica JL-4]
MKNIIYLFLLLSSNTVFAQECESDFIIVVDQELSPITFRVNTNSSFYIDWSNDGHWVEVTTNGMETIEHHFTGSIDTIRIRGELNHFNAPQSIIDVAQWGHTNFTSFQNAFYHCTNLIAFSAKDTPDLSSVSIMWAAFARATHFNGDLSKWNMSSVTDMGWMFSGASSFNGDLSKWDVSSVTDMPMMFEEALSFNGDISNWDVSSVEYMSWMFYGAVTFNSDISLWDVSSVVDMSGMFHRAKSFKGDLSKWDVTSVYALRSFLLDTNYPSDKYDDLLNSWSQLDLVKYLEIDISATYCKGEAGRQKIVSEHGWEIYDHGKSCPNSIDFVQYNVNNANNQKTKIEISGRVNWKLYDFNGQLIEFGSLNLKPGEELKWWELQKKYHTASILRLHDSSGKISVIKFSKV